MRRRSAEDKLYDNLVTLKKHLRSCRHCEGALKAMSPMDMCGAGMLLTLEAAKGYDNIIKLRVKAHTSHDGMVFACPDLTKHGKVYALTAPALITVGIQDTLL